MMPIDTTVRLPLDGHGVGSGSTHKVACSVIDLSRRHLPRDVSHLLADVVSPHASREGLELGLDVDGRLAFQPMPALSLRAVISLI